LPSGKMLFDKGGVYLANTETIPDTILEIRQKTKLYIIAKSCCRQPDATCYRLESALQIGFLQENTDSWEAS
jgi:phosphoribosyl 1,2-cyclic phosphodiesterase